MPGDVDLAHVGAALADPRRCRVLLALLDGRALPASVLAAEAGVAPSTASEHLRQLVVAGFCVVEPHGRFRYYRLAGPAVAELLEAAARLAPTQPVRSLREGTRAQALRAARSCYDHLAGRLGVDVMSALLARGHLRGHDGTFQPGAGHDRLSSRGRDHHYELTEPGRSFLADLGVPHPVATPVAYCIDWSEQRHHLAGPLGRALLSHLLALGWLRRADRGRALHVTAPGRRAFEHHFGIPVTAGAAAVSSRNGGQRQAAG